MRKESRRDNIDPDTRSLDRPGSGSPTDLVALFLAERQSAATRRAYAADLRDFFGGEPTPPRVQAFLQLPVPMLSLRLVTYKGELLGRGVSEATVNRRLSTVRSLLQYAYRRGLASTDGRGLVQSEPLAPRDPVACLPRRDLRRLIAAPGTKTVRGLRDTALLRLLCENALRRAELCALDVADFSSDQRRLMLAGKEVEAPGEPVPLSRQTTETIASYVAAAGHAGNTKAPLFRNLDHRPDVAGSRLTPDGLYFLVREYGREIGIEGLTPQQLRRSAIAAVLEDPGQDLRRVLRLSELRQRLEGGRRVS